MFSSFYTDEQKQARKFENCCFFLNISKTHFDYFVWIYRIYQDRTFLRLKKKHFLKKVSDKLMIKWKNGSFYAKPLHFDTKDTFYNKDIYSE